MYMVSSTSKELNLRKYSTKIVRNNIFNQVQNLFYLPVGVIEGKLQKDKIFIYLFFTCACSTAQIKTWHITIGTFRYVHSKSLVPIFHQNLHGYRTSSCNTLLGKLEALDPTLESGLHTQV